MSIFKPFKAFRPIKSKAKALASKPYDVLNSVEAREEAKGNPVSFYKVIKPEIDFPEEHNHYATEIYQKGKANFDALVKDGVMVQDSTENFYVYQLHMNGNTQTGLVGCCSIDDYFADVIKKHELTRPDKEEDRKNHIRHSKLNYEAVFLAYPQVDAIDTIVEEAKKAAAVYDYIADDSIRHQLWIIDDVKAIQQLSDLFATRVPSIYIADGHHRTAAGALVGKELREARGGKPGDGGRDNYLMAVLFPDNQLNIFDYNRVIKDLNGLTREAFLSKLEKVFHIEKRTQAYRPEHLHTFGMYMEGQWYKLSSKPGTYNDNDPIEQLDVTILSENVLEPLLNIVDLRTDTRIGFVGGIRGLEELEKRVDSGEMKVAFSMFPVSMKQLMDISDNGLIMPPKVTWFEPKLRSGLFVHDLAE